MEPVRTVGTEYHEPVVLGLIAEAPQLTLLILHPGQGRLQPVRHTRQLVVRTLPLLALPQVVPQESHARLSLLILQIHLCSTFHKKVNAIKPSMSESYVKNNNDIGKINQSVENETTEDIISEKDDNSYAALSHIANLEDTQYNFLGLPRHILILGLLPFFPVMLLFTASGGAAFFVTTGLEFIMR